LSQATPRRKKGKAIRLAVVLALLLAVFGIAGVVIAGEFMIDETKLTEMSQTSTVYDKDGQEIAALYVENRKLIED
jgi:penicillin-binding protein 2A